MSDREPAKSLIAAAKRGDRAAFEAMYELYAASVLGYVRGLGVPDPEDTLGEIFVSVVRDIGNFEGDEDGFRALGSSPSRTVGRSMHTAIAPGAERTPPILGACRRTNHSIDLADEVTDRVGLGARAQKPLTSSPRINAPWCCFESSLISRSLKLRPFWASNRAR